MSGCSKNSRRLARQLGETAAANLRRSGYTVTRNKKTGRYEMIRPAIEQTDKTKRLTSK